MAIRVRHSPPASTIADMAYTSGLGEYQRFQTQKQLELLRLAQQDMAQQRALAANAQSQARSQAFNAQQAGLDRQFRMGAFNAGAMLDQAKALQGRDWAVEDRDAGLAAARERTEMGLEGDRLAAEERARLDAESDARTAEMWAARDREDYLVAGLKSGSLKYDSKQVQSMNNLRKAMHAVRTDTDSMTPEDKQLALEEMQSEYDNIRLNPFESRPDEMPVGIEEAVNSQTAWIKGPDGKMRQYQRITRNGVEQFDLITEQDEDERTKFFQSFIGKTKTSKGADGIARQEPYTGREISKLWEEYKKAKEGSLPAEMPPEAMPPQPPPQPAPPGAMPPPPPVAGGVPFVPGQAPQFAPPPPQPGQVIEQGGQPHWVAPDGQPLPLHPRNSIAATQPGNLVVDEQGMIYLVQEAGKYLPIGQAEAPDNSQVPPDIAALPSGAVFTAPDGTRRRVP